MSEEFKFNIGEEAVKTIIDLRNQEPGEKEYALFLQIDGVHGNQFTYDLSFLDIEDAVFSPSINLVRVVLNREEILRSGRISLDYSGLLSNGSSILLSYYRDEKSFATSPTKSGRINGFAFGQTFSIPGGQGILGYKAIFENFRGGVDYEFFENLR